MQINDPARDLAWVFAKLDETHRNAVITAYGRVLGNRLDDLIMLRANLWVQMEQVGDFIKALNAGDNDRIMEFKAQVDRLAHKLGVSARAAHTARPASDAAATSGNAPSTVTVNTLLREDSRTAAPASSAGFPDDSTNETDVTGSRSYSQVMDDRTNSHPVAAVDDSTNDSPVLSSDHRHQRQLLAWHADRTRRGLPLCR